MRYRSLSWVFVFVAGIAVGAAATSAMPEYQTKVNTGLVNAANSVLQNLLGSSAASIRGFNPQPDPPRVMIHVNGETLIGTDLIVFWPPGPTRSSCQNVAKVSVGSGVVTLTRDINAGLELATEDLGALPPGPVCPAADVLPVP